MAKHTPKPAAPSVPSRLFPTGNSLPEGVRKKVIALLNARLVDCIDLQTQMKQAHWNVKGPNFIGLHKLFDEINEAVEEYVDLIAERAVQLGGVAMGTARMTAAGSTLDEYPANISDGADHVRAVAAALGEFGALVRDASDEAADLDDANTADLFTEVSRGIDQWLWFVEAHGQAKA